MKIPTDPYDQKLMLSMRRADSIARDMSPNDPSQWQRYIGALREVSLANWAATTDLEMKFNLVKTALNEIR